MKNVVILGAGTLSANLLSHRLDPREWTVTVIDHAKREVRTDLGTVAYDFLICALGCRTAPDEVEGMADAMGTGVHTFYTLEGALAMREALDRFEEGRLVIDICEMPIKCPVAPLEFAFLADYHFRRKGIRDRVEISLVTPCTGAFTKANANRILSKVADEKGIKVVPNFAISAVDAAKEVIRTFDGRTVDYDLLCAIPPNLGPAGNLVAGRRRPDGCKEGERPAGDRCRGATGRDPDRGGLPVGVEHRRRIHGQRTGNHRAQAARAKGHGDDRRRHHDAPAGHDPRERHARNGRPAARRGDAGSGWRRCYTISHWLAALATKSVGRARPGIDR